MILSVYQLCYGRAEDRPNPDYQILGYSEPLQKYPLERLAYILGSSIGQFAREFYFPESLLFFPFESLWCFCRITVLERPDRQGRKGVLYYHALLFDKQIFSQLDYTPYPLYPFFQQEPAQSEFSVLSIDTASLSPCQTARTSSPVIPKRETVFFLYPAHFEYPQWFQTYYHSYPATSRKQLSFCSFSFNPKNTLKHDFRIIGTSAEIWSLYELPNYSQQTIDAEVKLCYPGAIPARQDTLKLPKKMKMPVSMQNTGRPSDGIAKTKRYGIVSVILVVVFGLYLFFPFFPKPEKPQTATSVEKSPSDSEGHQGWIDNTFLPMIKGEKFKEEWPTKWLDNAKNSKGIQDALGKNKNLGKIQESLEKRIKGLKTGDLSGLSECLRFAIALRDFLKQTILSRERLDKFCQSTLKEIAVKLQKYTDPLEKEFIFYVLGKKDPGWEVLDEIKMETKKLKQVDNAVVDQIAKLKSTLLQNKILIVTIQISNGHKFDIREGGDSQKLTPSLTEYGVNFITDSKDATATDYRKWQLEDRKIVVQQKPPFCTEAQIKFDVKLLIEEVETRSKLSISWTEKISNQTLPKHELLDFKTFDDYKKSLEKLKKGVTHTWQKERLTFTYKLSD
jgi:hypothetical protein